jgi:D-alanyl-D-alanine carboxypeptidase (penicillin-binding protein 5/6)
LDSHVGRALVRAVIACSLLFASAAHAAAGFPRSKFAAISIDAEDGQVLYARNADARRYPASLTKVMTLYLAFDALDAGELHMDDRIRISPHAAAQPPTKLGLRAGSTIKVKDALNVIVVKSANDLAVALAEKIGGSEAKFVRLMNRKAEALGMKRTHFANASGLPNSHNVTTARDLAILGRAMVRHHPKRYALFDQTQTRYHGHLIRGHNPLLSHPGIDGFKTGYIRASGFNLMTSGVRDGHRVIAVVLGGSTARVRNRYMGKLMKASFAADDSRETAHPVLVSELLSGRKHAEPIQVAASTHEAEDRDDARASRWRVQVGAFSTAEASSARLAELAKQHPSRFDSDDAHVKPANGLYLARFSADSKRDAEEDCAILTHDGDDCLAVLKSP